MANFQSGGLVEQINTTATAAGTTTLVGSTSASATLGKQIQVFTGSSTQTVVLPSATTMVVGQKFEIYNESSSVLTIQFQDASAFTDASGVNYNILAPHTSLVVKLQTNGTANGTWAVLSTASTSSGTGINYITYGTAEAGTQGWHTVNWQQAVTITNASPAVFSVTSTTGMYVGMPISFTTTGALPTGLTASTIYFISSIPSGSTFQVSATLGGAAVNTSSAGSGTHTSYPLVPINDTTVALANLAFATSSSSPLVGANSYTLVQTNSKAVGGEGVAYDFTIDSAYEAQVLNISANYNASSTFVASSGSVGSDSDVEFAIWDKTNAVLIPITPKFVTGNGSNNFTFTASFQAASNSTSYALIVFSPTMNANATGWTFKFDNVQVGPNNSTSTASSSGAVIASYYMSANQSPGSNVQINFDTKLVDTNAAVTTGAGAWKFTAPVAGDYNVSVIVDYLTGTTGNVNIYKNGSSYAQISGGYGTGSGADSGVTGSTIIAMNAGDFIDFRPNTTATFGGGAAPLFTYVSIFLINGSQTSAGSSGQTVAAIVNTVSGSSITAGNPVVFTNVVSDSNGAYNTSTGLYTCPVSGYYNMEIVFGTITASNSNLSVQKNGAYAFGTSNNSLVANATSTAVCAGTRMIKCNAGDTLALVAVNSSAGVTVGSMDISLIGGASSALNAKTTVAASYYASANGTGSPTQTINFDTKIFDTTASVTASAAGTGTWKFTAPISGLYNIGGLFVSTTSGYYSVYKNGAAFASIGNDGNGGGQAPNFDIQLNAGDFIDIRPNSSRTWQGGTLTSVAICVICIKKVG